MIDLPVHLERKSPIDKQQRIDKEVREIEQKAYFSALLHKKIKPNMDEILYGYTRDKVSSLKEILGDVSDQ